MSLLGIILLVVLIGLLLGAIPAGRRNRNYGFGLGGLGGVLLIILILLLVFGGI